jgi:hypothetical protein
MAALQQADYVTFLKEWYQGTVVADLVYDNNPYLGIVPKNTNVRGNVYPKPIRFANVTGNSALYATADANQGPATRERWENVHIDNYSKASVSNRVMELSLGDPAAFREALQDSVDSAFNAFANDMAYELFGDGTGTRGVVSAGGAPQSVPSATNVPLGLGEARFFEVGMVLQHSLAAGASLLNTGEESIVTEVDRALDQLTIAPAWTTVSIATHKLYRSGDFDAKANGLPAWLVVGASPGTFLGVNRDLDPTRLAGVQGTTGATSGSEITESLVLTGADLQAQGGKPNLILLHPTDRAALALETEFRGGRYAKVTSTEGNISFSALEIETGAGPVPVLSDPNMTPNKSYMIDTRTHELFSAGGAPRMFKKDGSFYQRAVSLDEISFYLFGFYNLSIQNPGGNAVTAALV